MSRNRLLTVGATLCLLIGSAAAAEDLRPADDFYTAYPVYKEFFPFGVYGGLENFGYTSHNINYMDPEDGYRFMLEGLRENYLNLIWGGNVDYNLREQADGYVLSPQGKTKSRLISELDMYILPMFRFWFAQDMARYSKTTASKTCPYPRTVWTTS